MEKHSVKVTRTVETEVDTTAFVFTPEEATLLAEILMESVSWGRLRAATGIELSGVYEELAKIASDVRHPKSAEFRSAVHKELKRRAEEW